MLGIIGMNFHQYVQIITLIIEITKIFLSKNINSINILLNDHGSDLKGIGSNVFKQIFYFHADVSFVGLGSFNINSSGVGMQNKWVNLEIGKGRESWGAGSDIQLALSDKSKPYDYFKLTSDYGRIRVSYLHGYLETINNGVNRYINARGIEWTNKKSIIMV